MSKEKFNSEYPKIIRTRGKLKKDYKKHKSDKYRSKEFRMKKDLKEKKQKGIINGNGSRASSNSNPTEC